MSTETILELYHFCKERQICLRVDSFGIVLTKYFTHFPNDLVFNRAYTVEFLSTTMLSFLDIVNDFIEEAEYKYNHRLLEECN